MKYANGDTVALPDGRQGVVLGAYARPGNVRYMLRVQSHFAESIWADEDQLTGQYDKAEKAYKLWQRLAASFMLAIIFYEIVRLAVDKLVT